MSVAMSTDLENLTASLGLVRREFLDVHAIASCLDHQVPRAMPRPGGLVARFAACKLIAHREKRQPVDVCRQHFAADRDLAHLIELKAAVTPGQTTVATWAAELAAVVWCRTSPTICCRRRCWRNCAASAWPMGSLTARSHGCRCIRRRRAAALSPRAALFRSAR
jgi:hypothetical protein